MGIPEDEAEYYEGEFKSGRTIVTVKADGRYDEASNILRRFGAYEKSTAATHSTSALASERHESHAHTQTATGMHASTGARNTAGGQTIQAREEELQVRKTPVEKGEVEVRKEVHTEHKTLNVPVEREEVVIERHPVSGHQPASGDIREGEKNIRIPIREEEVHVEKTPVVKEEISVGKRKVQSTEQVSGTVRKEDIHVEKHGDVERRDDRR
jgi:uncharacterized protein (TIGR02271 family)